MRNAKSNKTATAWLLATALVVGLPQFASAETVLRIGMTAADIPRTLGQPDQGFEGNRFTGLTMYDGLTLWDLSIVQAVSHRKSTSFNYEARAANLRLSTAESICDESNKFRESRHHFLEKQNGQTNHVASTSRENSEPETHAAGSERLFSSRTEPTPTF